jgi:pyridoxine 5-phosphate synthase
MTRVRLGVNIDHIATLRQQRRGRLPDPVEAALACERSGADGIVCHLREDRRHIQDEDVRRLKAAIATRLNLEMSLAPEIVEAALAIRPHQVTLVPERRQELTTEGGLDVIRLEPQLTTLVWAFQRQGIEVSLFVDPAAAQLEACRRTGAAIIELHTGAYAASGGPGDLEALRQAAARGRALGLSVAAGHGLDYENVQQIRDIPEVEELNIGFSIVTRALAVGLERAVRDMADLLQRRRADALRAP